MNKLLQRQIQEFIDGAGKIPPGYTGLFNAISDAYDMYDKDRQMVERSIESNSKETVELYEKLRIEKEEVAGIYRELQMMLANIDDIFFSIDMSSYRFSQLSPACEKLLGYKAEQLLAMPDLGLSLIVEEDRPPLQEASYLVNAGQAWMGQCRIYLKDGSIRWFEIKLKPTLDCDGKLLRIDGLASDINEAKTAQQLLVDKENRYRALVENSGDGVAVFAADGKPIYLSPAIERILGYSEEEGLQLNLFSLVHPDDMRYVKEVWEKVLANSSVPHAGNTCRILHKDGNWRWIEGTLTNMLNESSVGGIVDNFRDVTERLAADRALRHSEEKTGLIMNAAMDAILCHDDEDIITFWNKQAENIFGWNAEEVIGKKAPDIIFPSASRETYRRKIKRHISLQEGPMLNKRMELSAIDRDERLFKIELTIMPVTQHEKTFFCSFIRDITERKRYEEKLHNRTAELTRIKEELEQSEKSLKEAQTIAQLGSWEADFDSSNVVWSDETYRIFGLKVNELTPSLKLFYSFIHPGDIDTVKEIVNKASKQMEGYSFDCRIIRTDGALRYIYVDWRFLYNKSGWPCRLQGIVHDITESQEAEIRLRHSESRLNQAQAVAKIGHWELNFATKRSKWSDEAYRIYGIEPGDHNFPKEVWLSFIHPDDREMVKSVVSNSEQTQTDLFMEHRILRSDGTVRYVSSEAKYEFDHNGHPVGLYGIVRDITEQKINEEKLKSLNEQINKRAEELSASNAELERFAYVASHDLQEPLRMVSSFLQLLQKKYTSQLDNTADQYIKYAVDGADRMKRLILDLLEYSRVGTNTDRSADTDINEVIQNVLHTFEHQIRASDAKISIHAMPVIASVKTQMIQMFQNLVGNALKYNQSGAPEIEIGCEEQGDWWRFFVKDNGIGIEPKYFEKVFAIFQRLHNRNEFSGTGIGLAICKKIAEKHGGHIWVESVLGKGSTFFFTIKK